MIDAISTTDVRSSFRPAGSVRHVVNFSGGACSFWALDRVLGRYGRDGGVALFADTLIEDEDLYRFLGEASEYHGVPITRVSKEQTPWELFAEEGMIGNSKTPLCSIRLKRELLDTWREQHGFEFTTTLHLGLDWTEEHRLTAARLEMPYWRVEAPMCEPPLWDKCRMVDELRKVGIQPPRLYEMGFPHNNCGGFCVKAGQAHFAHLLKVMPERYAFHESKEEELRLQVGDFSVMKDRRGGKAKTLTMRQLRERIESGENFDRGDWGGCGCAVDAPKKQNQGLGGNQPGDSA